MAAAGGAVWLVLLGGVLLNFSWLSIFDLLFLLAPWVVVPLALSLVPEQTNPLSQVSKLVARYLLLPGAALATAGFFLNDGWTAGALTGVWVVMAAFLAVDGLQRVIRTRL